MAISKTKRRKVYDKYGGRCAYCGRKVAYGDMQVDHIHPRSMGGDDGIDNLNPACRMCNERKGAMALDQFRNEIRRTVRSVCKIPQMELLIAFCMLSREGKSRVFYCDGVSGQSKATYIGNQGKLQ